MHLYWIKYQPRGHNPRYMLVYALGETGNKMVCLDTEAMQPNDKTFLKNKSAMLSKTDLSGRVALLKELRPDIMHHCKTIFVNNFSIIKTYQIPS